MSKYLSFALTVAMLSGLLLTGCGSAPAPTEPVSTEPTVDLSKALFKTAPGEDGVYRILMIGNSGCYYYCDELYEMLAADGIKAEVFNLYYSGCRVQQHWEWLQSGEAKYQLICHSERGKEVLQGYTLDASLRMRNWDTITLQQAFWPQWTLENAKAYTKDFSKGLFEYMKPLFPMTTFLWHHTWAYQVGFVPLSGEKENSPENYKVKTVEEQTAFYQMIKTVCEEVAEENGVDIIPVGDAWDIARKDPVIGDNLCARKGVNDDKGDYLHDGDIGGGQYLNACVWYGIITGKSPVGHTFRPDYALSEELVAALQKAAQQSIDALSAK